MIVILLLSFVTDCPFFTQGCHSWFMLITTLSFILLCKEVRLPTFFTVMRLQIAGYFSYRLCQKASQSFYSCDVFIQIFCLRNLSVNHMKESSHSNNMIFLMFSDSSRIGSNLKINSEWYTMQIFGGIILNISLLCYF